MKEDNEKILNKTWLKSLRTRELSKCVKCKKPLQEGDAIIVRIRGNGGSRHYHGRC